MHLVQKRREDQRRAKAEAKRARKRERQATKKRSQGSGPKVRFQPCLLGSPQAGVPFWPRSALHPTYVFSFALRAGLPRCAPVLPPVG